MGQITCHDKVGDLSLIHRTYIREQAAVISSFLGGTEGRESRLLQDNPELPSSLTCSTKHSGARGGGDRTHTTETLSQSSLQKVVF